MRVILTVERFGTKPQHTRKVAKLRFLNLLLRFFQHSQVISGS